MPREKPTATRSPVVEHDPGLVGGPAPALAGLVDLPGPSIFRWVWRVHGWSVSIRVSRCLPRESVWQDGAAGQVGGGQLRDPEVGAR